MMKETKRDMLVYAAVCIAAIVVYFWVIPTQIYLSGSAKAESFSPDTFPRFVTILLMLSSVGGFINALCRHVAARRKAPAGADQTVEAAPAAEPRTTKDRVAPFIPYLIFLLVLLYGILFSRIGFIAATAIVPPIILFVIGCRKWQYYLIYYVFAAALYALFKYLLLVPIR